MAAAPSLKQYLHTLADELSDTATTDEALYHVALRREIEAGLADSEAGRTRAPGRRDHATLRRA